MYVCACMWVCMWLHVSVEVRGLPWISWNWWYTWLWILWGLGIRYLSSKIVLCLLSYWVISPALGKKCLTLYNMTLVWGDPPHYCPLRPLHSRINTHITLKIKHQRNSARSHSVHRDLLSWLLIWLQAPTIKTERFNVDTSMFQRCRKIIWDPNNSSLS